MKYNTGLFLFGSYMQSVNPHDIDLLWLYDKTVMSPDFEYYRKCRDGLSRKRRRCVCRWVIRRN